jgi:hypothetical protein
MGKVSQDPPENQRSALLRAHLASTTRRLGPLTGRRGAARLARLAAQGGALDADARRLLELYRLVAEIGRRQAHLRLLGKGPLGPEACASAAQALASVAEVMRPAVELLALLGGQPPKTAVEEET